MNESNGIAAGAGALTAFGPPPVATTVNASGAIDWNRDGDTLDTVNRDVNNFAYGSCVASPGQTLNGYDDWTNLGYNFRKSFDFADGVHVSVLEAPEVTRENAALASPDSDADTVPNVLDNCPFFPNTDQLDGNANGIGDACEFSFTGFFSPVDNPPAVNTGRTGRAYPVKFRITNLSGPVTTVQAVLSIRSVRVRCGTLSGDATDALETTAAGASALRYDTTSNQFVYNWKTPDTPGCYELRVSLADGTTVATANFNLTR